MALGATVWAVFEQIGGVKARLDVGRVTLEDLAVKIKDVETAAVRAAGLTPTDQLKEEYLQIPSISFHYADEKRIRDYYNDYFMEPTIESLVREVVAEASGDLGATVPEVLEARIGSRDIAKWVQQIKLPQLSLSGMFLRLQRETIKNNQILIGIELVNIEMTEIDEFDKAVEVVKEFGFSIENARTEVHKARLKEKSAGKTIAKLENISGWVLVEGKFKITRSGDEYYKLIYEHPLNQYVTSTDVPIIVSVLVPVKGVADHVAGHYASSVSETIVVRVYGEVWQPIDRDQKSFELEITPLAVY